MNTTQRGRLRELRRQLMRQWRYSRPGSRRRELLRALIGQADTKLSGKEAVA
jgi:hypothetical protein